MAQEHFKDWLCWTLKQHGLKLWTSTHI